MNHFSTSTDTLNAPFSSPMDKDSITDRPPQEPFVPFDHRNSQHRKDLLYWCRQNWDSTFKRSLSQSNPIYYHDCCTCFSRRGFAKVAGHPQLESSSILRIPSFKMVADSDQFYRWLLGMFALSAERGQRTYFPAINRFHLHEEALESDAIDRELVCLKKRMEDMHLQMTEQGKKLKDLETVNHQLLASSKSWHQKYVDLLDKQDPLTPPEFGTPMKKKTKYFEYSELY